jgi:glutamate-1-semialdehyde 2,1-aminomutase
MTAGLWSLKRLSKGLYKHLSDRGAQLAEGLADAARSAGVALQVNGIGSALTPFFSSEPVKNYQTALRADAAKYGTFFKGMLARGVYPPPSQFEAWFLSGAHTKRDVEKTIKAAREAMKDIAGRV